MHITIIPNYKYTPKGFCNNRNIKKIIVEICVRLDFISPSDPKNYFTSALAKSEHINFRDQDVK